MNCRLQVWPPWSPRCDLILTTWTSTCATPRRVRSLSWLRLWAFRRSCRFWRLCAAARSRGRLATRESRSYNRLRFSWAVPFCRIWRIWWKSSNMVCGSAFSILWPPLKDNTIIFMQQNIRCVWKYLHNLTLLVAGLVDEQQKVRTITALALAALAEAATPYGIESFDSVLKPLWRGIRQHRGKVIDFLVKFAHVSKIALVLTLHLARNHTKWLETFAFQGLAAFLKAIGYLIPLMDAEYANYYTREVMLILVREFQSPDEEMKKIVLKVRAFSAFRSNRQGCKRWTCLFRIFHLKLVLLFPGGEAVLRHGRCGAAVHQGGDSASVL